MKKNVFFKVFFTSVVWTAACMGLAAIAADKAQEKDPNIFEKVADRLEGTSNIHVSFRGHNDGDFADSEDTWSFPVPTEAIDLTSVNGDVEILQAKAGTPLVISARGKRHKSIPKLLETIATKQKVSVAQPENETTRKLEIQIRVPEDFKGKLSIKTVSGETEMESLSLNSLNVESVSGDVEIDKASLDEANVKTVSGKIRLQNRIRGKLILESVTGDCSVRIAHADKTHFQLATVSGNIKNSKRDDPAGETLVRVKTTSGDIEIL